MSAAANNLLTSASRADLVFDQAAIGRWICRRTSLTPGITRTGGTKVEASMPSSIKVWPTSNATSFKGCDLNTPMIVAKCDCGVLSYERLPADLQQGIEVTPRRGRNSVKFAAGFAHSLLP